MEVTLRKAAALSKALLEAARKPKLNKTVEVSIYTDGMIDDSIQEAVDTLASNLSLIEDRVSAAFEIRGQIAGANHAAGVNRLLTQMAQLDALERFLAAALEGPANGTPADIAQAKLNAMIARAADKTAYVSEELEVNFLGAADLPEAREKLRQLRRTKASLADSLLVLNTNTSISLSDYAVSALRGADLI